MSDTLEGIEKDPRVESLYGASKDSPGLCDLREEAGDHILAAVQAAVAQVAAEFRSDVFSPEWKLTANNNTFAMAVAAALRKFLPTCDPRSHFRLIGVDSGREEAAPPQCRYDHNGDGNCHRCYRAGGCDDVSLAEGIQD